MNKIPTGESNAPLGLKIVNEEMGDEPVLIQQMLLFVNNQLVESKETT
ncbi:MAG: hypothetical protein MJ201_01305 [Mycoplasmoidaceae bacterium]|nr:hypothetical protein [Mycoplasmoidaceae bacterium]